MQLVSKITWWTHDGSKLPPLSFQMYNQWESSEPKHSGFDLAAATEGWQQLRFSDDRRSIWVQQLCLDQQAKANETNGAAKIQYATKPIFHAMAAIPNAWCRNSYSPRPFDPNSPRYPQTVRAYPIYYRIECVEELDKNIQKYLVRVQIIDHR
ncbi:hypothetical protein PHET_03427 [Paragonimus heterotremus]|uniref:Uncharacterized protein n=1 Tax=Paragonimus heterotremus TaxID=100268 RepID=A0A8J4TE39_9TREM|nr:hypothetical protein PHET_03427 [Paragonimus heterotremus]